MPDQLKRTLIGTGNYLDFAAGTDRISKVTQLAIQGIGNRFLGKRFGDAPGNFTAGNAGGKFTR
jgi:hypothetical protein